MLNIKFRGLFGAFITLFVIGNFLVGSHTANAATFSGQATVTVQLINVYGQILGVQSYSTNVGVYIRPPNPGETNPFSLVIQSTPLANSPGEISLNSSLPAQGVLFQYWTYQIQNGMLQGTLTNNHVNEAIALNSIIVPAEIAPNLWLPTPLAMANGTTMTGFINESQIQLQVIGNTTDMAHPFQIDIFANRIQ